MLNEDTNILITGATGLIGGELVRRLVGSGVGRVSCLIRPQTGRSADDRLQDRFRLSSDQTCLGGEVPVEAVAGDVTAPQFGMNSADFARVTDSVDMIIHCASELSFIRDISCRQTNIAGMENLISLTRSCKRSPLIVHISTATVCGTVVNRCVTETDDTDTGDGHFNEYTRSKLVAEQVLRASGLPALVVRPSIVLSAELPSENFAKAILWFLPLLNEFEAVPVNPESRVDVVPVSFVVESMVRLLQTPKREYGCYHISAGEGGAMRCGQVAGYLDKYYARSTPLTLIRPDQWTREIHRRYVRTPRQRKFFATLKYYLPFLNMDVVYDNSRLGSALGREALEIPHVTEYIGQLLDLVTPAIQEEDGSLSVNRVSAATSLA
ncbi:MAG: NAD-dependent epimerase/dehydratase family protein [Phycisphaerae bacterium]|nr:NAD-dependent epimerase/dehydratase family protein [Phycisphaerae bacterium]